MLEFAEASKPARRIWVVFGPFGVHKTTAQVTRRYSSGDLLGRQIIGVLNCPPRQIGPFVSEATLTGFHADKRVVITLVERLVPTGRPLA